MKRKLAGLLKSEANQSLPGFQALSAHQKLTPITGAPGEKELDEQYRLWPIVPVWYADHEMRQFLTTTMHSVMECTQFYYRGFYTWYGERPFEVFILSSYFNKLTGGGYDIDKAFKEECLYDPFLEPLIIDTINFVLTGKRQYPVRLLLEDAVSMPIEEKRYGSEPARLIKPMFKWSEVRRMSSKDFLTKWLSQKGGIADFVNSHRIMLGSY